MNNPSPERLGRTPEPAPSSPTEEAAAYSLMDHRAVNEQFVTDLMTGPVGPLVIDLGCGPAEIPILLCDRLPESRVLAVDAEPEMLEIAKRDIDMAGLLEQITLQHADVGQIDDWDDGIADTVISNSLIHHLDAPEIGIRTAARLVRPGGRLFIRDLYRPATESIVEQLVSQYTGEETTAAQQLFRQSLHAALTLEEIRSIARGLGIDEQSVQMSSDRHWTLDWIRPE